MNEMLDFVKAMSHPDRLRIIGVLSQKASTRTELAMRLELPMKEVVDHLADLQQVGAISENAETYAINDERLGALAREKLAQERPAYIPSDEWDEKSKKVLKAHLHADGKIKQVPSQPAKLKVILKYLLSQFEMNKNYTEKEVNMILRGFNEDTAGLRRELVDAGMLDREGDGSRYWRVDYGK
jgi:ArsR family transcriptional regulator, arsenate/arsenite/antimonite-responsive transcriptional repressor